MNFKWASGLRFTSVGVNDSLWPKTHMFACRRNDTTIVEKAKFGEPLMLTDSEPVASGNLGAMLGRASRGETVARHTMISLAHFFSKSGSIFSG